MRQLLRRAALAAVALCVTATSLHAAPLAEEALPPVELGSLHYGDVLFHFFQDDWFDAIVRAESYEAQGLLAPHGADAELLLGGLYLSFGHPARAAEIFGRLLADESTPAAVRGKAWFYLGKVQFARGDYESAGESLRRASGNLPEALEAERRVLLAQNLIQRERFADAAQVLDSWSGPADWQAYGQFNLGVALVRAGREEEGLRRLDSVGQLDAQSEELRALRDKANVALGFAHLQADRPGDARLALERVRLTGPEASKALLGAGWAAAAEKRFDAALAYWTELRDRALLDSAVQESYLAVPYAYAQLAANGQAAISYEVAIAGYEGEQRRIGESIDAIRAGRLLAALQVADPGQYTGWFTNLQALPDEPETRYLYHLMAGHEFQEAYKNYRALVFLRRNVERWSADLGVLDHMVGTRREAFAAKLPAAASQLEAVDLDALAKRRDALRAWHDRAVGEQDWSLLADADEQRLLALAAGVDAELVSRAGDPALDEAREKARLARGVLMWRLDAAGKERAWLAGRHLKSLDAQMATARMRMGTAAEAMESMPLRNDELAARIAALQPRVDDLAARLASARDRQADHLAALAIRELEVQQERLASYTAQARFELAALYDRAAAPTGDAEGGGPR